MKTSGKLLVIIAGLVFSLIAIPLLALFVSTSTAQAYRGQPGPAAGQTQTAQGQTCPNCTGQGVGYGMGHRGAGGMGGPGMLYPISNTPLTADTVQAMTEALNNEYQARAQYQAVVDKFGQVLPFSNILRSESTHIAALQRLFTARGLTVPADSFAGQVKAPETLAEAYQAAIQTEQSVVTLYDRLLQAVKEPADVVNVFTRLQAASANMHLVAFQAYAK